MQVEHVNSLRVPYGSPNVGPSLQGRDETETWPLNGFPQNQFRPDAAGPRSPWGPAVHGQAGASGATRQEPSQSRRNYPTAAGPRPVPRHNSVVLHPRQLQLQLSAARQTPRSDPPRSTPPPPPRARHGSRQDKPGAAFVLSNAIASGTAISNGKSFSAGSARDYSDRRRGGPAAATKWEMDAPRAGELPRSPSTARLAAAAVAPPTLSPGNFAPRAAPNAGPGKPARRSGAKVAGRMVRRPSFRYFKASNRNQLPDFAKAYGKSALGTESSYSVGPQESAYQSAGRGRRVDVAHPRRRFPTAGEEGPSEGFAPTKVLTIPTRFGSVVIQRLRDPLKNGGAGVVSRPQATTATAPPQKSAFYAQRVKHYRNRR